MSSSAPQFLSTVLANYAPEPPHNRPHVTLTFAQSIDAKIGDAHQRQLILSGKESMIMTHWMRTMHDAILVGIGTAMKDNPQLNVRHLPPPTHSSPPHHLPRPIIVDTSLKLSPTCKLLKNFQAGTGRRPWIISSSLTGQADVEERKEALKAAGARILEVSMPSDGTTIANLPIILRNLRENGVKSVMVEGGARIISSFLQDYPEPLVDTLIITIAPVLVGNDGVAYNSPTSTSPDSQHKKRFEVVHTEAFGRDTVIAMNAVPL